MFKPPIGRLFCCPVFISSFWVDNVVSCNQAEEESRVNLGSESETVEFKKSTGEHKEALQAISAMLNKHGGGELYFGVKDNGDVIDIAAKHGKATPKTLASQAQISRKTASLVLKGLEKKGVLRWSGKSTMDPYQFYELPN